MDDEQKETHRPNGPVILTRRDFIKGVGMGGGALVLLGQFGINGLAWALSGDPELKMVLVDYTKCTGCRTCETACSAKNRPVSLDGRELPGLGNPHFANIRVHSFNPDVDVPSVCAMCADNPCVKACPVEPDAKTGRRALYRDDKTRGIRNDAGRCLGCRSCAKACAAQRTGVISPTRQRASRSGCAPFAAVIPNASSGAPLGRCLMWRCAVTGNSTASGRKK
ncbi:twin-arginine translocation signal domain-containing protein [Geotalea toluenoxydans]|uniref:twin-arginine translocation signal domain-containing protein n=1 Tax=Geotalea toluenoxydans TaxID=421624 RepID=UPI000AAA718F|nr:twin-arginine translocation signal domain-containing protein [Geotalea toluenoxydans]